MRELLVCLLALATLLPAEEKKSKPERPPDVTLLEMSARREKGLILIDGLVRVNAVEKPLIGLQVRFKLLAAGEQLISQQDTVVTKEILEEGDEAPFYVQCRDHARAVEILVEMRGKKRMYLNLENPGPYMVE
jgi:hypothetical protein